MHATECHVRTSNCRSKKIITRNVICPFICSFQMFYQTFLINSKSLVRCMYSHICLYSYVSLRIIMWQNSSIIEWTWIRLLLQSYILGIFIVLLIVKHPDWQSNVTGVRGFRKLKCIFSKTHESLQTHYNCTLYIYVFWHSHCKI